MPARVPGARLSGSASWTDQPWTTVSHSSEWSLLIMTRANHRIYHDWLRLTTMIIDHYWWLAISIAIDHESFRLTIITANTAHYHKTCHYGYSFHVCTDYCLQSRMDDLTTVNWLCYHFHILKYTVYYTYFYVNTCCTLTHADRAINRTHTINYHKTLY